MENIARVFIVGGLLLTASGVVLWAGAKLGMGRLPGDLLIERGNAWIAVPLATSLILSVVLTIALNVAIRIWR